MDPCASRKRSWLHWPENRLNGVGTMAARMVPVVVALVAAASLLSLAPSVEAGPTCKLNIKGLSVCFGKYALCDKATCKASADGKTAECTCPVLDGPSLADPSQTNGTCTPKQPGGVYSFFSLEGFDPKDQLACPAGHWAQCWNAPCELLAGGKQARCVCPLCSQSFTTPGGDCNPANCTGQILVGAPFPAKGAGGCKSKGQ
jgi:hypothetical protein